MKKRNREINIFTISMLDVLTGAMGIFLIILVLLLPYYKKGRTVEEILEKLTGYEQEQKRLIGEKDRLQKQLSEVEDEAQQLSEDKDTREQQIEQCRETNETLTGGKTELAALLTTCQDENAKNIAEKNTLTGQWERCQDQYTQAIQDKEQVVGELAQCRNQVTADAKEKAELAAKNQQLTGQLQQCQDSNAELTGGRSQLTDLLARCQEENAGATTAQNTVTLKFEDCQNQLALLTQDRLRSNTQFAECREDLLDVGQELEDVRKLGFEVQEKKIVFVVDISTSMSNDKKIENVTTGIKMQIATMDESYETDVVFFPNKPASADYGDMWRGLKKVTPQRKYAAYKFLSGLQAAGSTPTESVLNYVLDHYPEAGAIILFSDGAPAVGDRELPWSDLQGILARVTAKNNRGKKINTIGVGPEFRDENSAADKVRFLKMLAEQNGGFYAGF